MNFKTTFFTAWFLVFAFNKAFSATTATLLLKGTVAPVLEVSTTSETVAANLPFESAQTNLKIGTVIERSNSLSGYQITITSANLGHLQNDSANYVVYTLTYDGQAVNLIAQQSFTFPFVSAAPVERDLRISYSQPSEDLAAGDYTDTLTFMISVN